MKENCDGGLDVRDDELDEDMNAMGDVDDDLEEELLNFNYVPIQFGIIPSGFSVNMPSLYLPSLRIIKGSLVRLTTILKKRTNHAAH